MPNPVRFDEQSARLIAEQVIRMKGIPSIPQVRHDPRIYPPPGAGSSQLGFPDSDIPSEDYGLVNVQDKDGAQLAQVRVYNPHSMALVTSELVQVWECDGYDASVASPHQFVTCDQIIPTFDPETP